MLPRLGSVPQFAALRQFLSDAGYYETAVCERMGIRALSESLGMRSACAAEDRLELLIHLFLLSESVAEDEALAHASARDLGLLFDLALLERDAAGRLSATVSLYPVGALWIISDTNQTSEHDQQEAGSPRVFSAITPHTGEFLAMLPRTPCPALLELCAGAGAAALLAASDHAVQAWALDISERSCHFAEFSRRLNALENLTVRQGDLYAPAGRRTFDRIVAHPPYVPSLRSEQLFRDGGEDGEWLTRRIIEGLPNYLHPGGALYCLCLLAQVADDAIEKRIRRWLRERQREFDLVLIERRTVEPARLILDNWSQRYSQDGDLARWQNVLRQRRIEGFVYVTMILQRHAGEARPLTIVRQAGADWSIEDAHEHLRFDRAVADFGTAGALDGLALTAAAGAGMSRQQSWYGAGWSEPRYSYRVENPFRYEYEGPAWIGDVLARAGGAVSASQLYETLGLRDVGWEEFATVVAGLVSGGLLHASGGSGPEPRASSSPSRIGR